jgi:hypothetical protein
MRILLQPASGPDAMKHFEDTIVHGVSIENIQNRITAEELKILKELRTDIVKVWGIVPTPENEPRRQFIELSEDDIVLFYAHRQFYYAAKVLLKIHSKELALEFWGTDTEGRTWEYIYFIKEGINIETPYDSTVLNYKPNHIIQGAILLNDVKSHALLNYIEHHEGEIVDDEIIEPSSEEEQDLFKRIPVPRTPEEADILIKKISNELKDEPVEKRIRIAKILARNPKFARLIKEKAKYICEICNVGPFLQKNGEPYAEAHHKYELSKTRIDNPKDMICVCPTCHRVVHYGNDKALQERSKIAKRGR